MFIRPLISFPHQGPEGGGSSVKNINPVFLYDTPEPVGVRIGRDSLEHEAGGSKGQWSVYDITMARYPPDIGSTPEGVLIFNIKYPLKGLVNVE